MTKQNKNKIKAMLFIATILFLGLFGIFGVFGVIEPITTMILMLTATLPFYFGNKYLELI